jgi:hypothetical protein
MQLRKLRKTKQETKNHPHIIQCITCEAEKALLNKPREKKNHPLTPRYISYAVEKALLNKKMDKKQFLYYAADKTLLNEPETNVIITLFCIV